MVVVEDKSGLRSACAASLVYVGRSAQSEEINMEIVFFTELNVTLKEPEGSTTADRQPQW